MHWRQACSWAKRPVYSMSRLRSRRCRASMHQGRGLHPSQGLLEGDSNAALSATSGGCALASSGLQESGAVAVGEVYTQIHAPASWRAAMPPKSPLTDCFYAHLKVCRIGCSPSRFFRHVSDNPSAASGSGPTQQADHAARLARHDRHHVTHDLHAVEALRISCQGLAQPPSECLPQHRGDVELCNTPRSREACDIAFENT